ncbi:MAG: Fic family protein [Candidatus Micrarchaeota archaeon]|nr:Fic family protein [Candidatus Micrarchaeota archaeon]
MPFIKKLRRNGNVYYYLEHSVRDGDNVYKKRKYLGKRIPEEIARIKTEFVESVYEEQWYAKFEEIKVCYGKAIRKTPQTVRAKNTEAFMVRFTYDTQRIEGSKLSLQDTSNLLTRKVAPKNGSLDDIKEAEAHKKVFYSMLSEKKELSLGLVLSWHSRLFDETKPDVAGKIRDYPVIISGSEFIPPKANRIPELLEEFFDWYSEARKESNPIKLAALVHLKFVTIHPFGDGNGRISRLMMNFVLNRHGYPMLDIKYTSRKDYYVALREAQLGKDENEFLVWLFRRYIQENEMYL